MSLFTRIKNALAHDDVAKIAKNVQHVAGAVGAVLFVWHNRPGGNGGASSNAKKK